MAVRTLDFLPAVFRTATNQKFLNATIEQATTEVDLKRLNGFIGRKFTPTFKSADNYIPESSTDRANYQLEPSAVLKTDAGEVSFVNNYNDLLNTIETEGGITNNHDRLFNSESYTFTGEIDLDKFVNFAQYYWLPTGPDAVDIRTTTVETQENYTVTRSATLSEYAFAEEGDVGIGLESNPTIYIARGGSYTFRVSQNGNPFWIQTELGTSGFRLNQKNISSRDILGVENNGDDNGIITFNVPQKTAQDFYINMNKVDNVDLATTLQFRDLNNQLLSTVQDKFGGIDGQRNLADKTVVFLNQESGGWQTGGVFDLNGVNYDSGQYDEGYEPTDDEKYGIWQIFLIGDAEDPIVTFRPVQEIPVNNKVLALEGVENGNKEIYRSTSGFLEVIPVITAILDQFFYQDGTDAERYGTIKIVEPETIAEIDVETDILGRKNYTSPGAVVFTNGLKVRFDNGVTPAKYANENWYVEGVGRAITLTKVDNLVTPESFSIDESIGFDIDLYDSQGYESSANAPTVQDYVVAKRDCLDGNAWARGNRWFHEDVINATATYNKFTPVIDQSKRGKRPIIEFNSNLQLYNFGRRAKDPVDIIETTELDAFTNVEGTASYSADGITLVNGHRVIFANDRDDDVRNKIYEVRLVDPQDDGTFQISLTPTEDSTVVTNETVVVKLGSKGAGKQYWYNGTEWIQGQQKTGFNQSCKFDVFDSSGNSFGNATAYPGTDFTGTKTFSYKQGTGTNDTVLGFPLSYRNFESVGDILFENNYYSDTFKTTASNTNKVSKGFLHVNTDISNFTLTNTWKKTNTETRQFQQYSYEYTGSNLFLYPATEITNINRRTLKVFVGSVLLNDSQYTKTTSGAKTYIQIDSTVDLTGKTITILVLSKDPLANTKYQVPINLDNNSLNENFSEVSLGQLRNHFQVEFENATETTGVFPGGNNSRDLEVEKSEGTIVQHTGGMPYAMLFMGDKLLNFFDALETSAREYTNFKYKFLERSYTLPEIEFLTVDGAVDAILANINEAKTDSFPWYYSDMIPSGEDVVENSYTWASGNSKAYRLTTAVDMNSPSNKSVLVFNGTTQLLRYRDYDFSSDGLFVELTSTYTPTVGDIIKIREYNSTHGSFIPETPTKMGLYAKYEPRLLTDTTYASDTTFIIGHDGSYTPVFGDRRDDLLLELEKRIYNNIKVVYDKSRLDVHDVLPGQFRSTDYTRAECLEIIGSEFARWAGNNQIDYTQHDFFRSSDPFTFNWNQSASAVDGEILPGYWRGVYRYYYDTDTPHLTPWECLGLSEEPTWWKDAYGTAPFSAGNLVLWDDLEAGYIKEPGNERYDTRYKRPGVTKYIPINVYGELRPPNEFLVRNFNGNYVNNTFSIGDESPAETAWIKSSHYPFAVQKLLALTKPAKYFGLNARVSAYTKNTALDQFVLSATNQRITKDDIQINGALVNGVRQYTAGYVNWIASRVRDLGIDPAVKVRNALDNLSIQLSYKIGGFTDKSYLKVLAEQNSPQSTTDSVVIPDSDYDLFLQKSNRINRLSYSAVVVEKVASGYKVEGYDLDDPFFRVVPSRPNSKENLTQINIFGTTVEINNDFLPVFETVPYGKTFKTNAEVIDFLVSYGRFLTSQGFVFQGRVGTLGETKSWLTSAREFLTWAEQGWAVGNLIVLAPAFDMVELILENSTIDNITGEFRGSQVLDQNFNRITNKDLQISRIKNSVQIKSLQNRTIGLVVLDEVQYEHVLVPNNTTVFNDVIYKPELGNRQGRLKLVGFKTNNWDGTLTPGGFILNQDNIQTWKSSQDYKKGSLVKFKTNYYTALQNLTGSVAFDESQWEEVDYDKIKKGLLPNFANTASGIETFYDVDDINLESDRDVLAKSLIGYKNRSYLDNLGLDDTSQVKFYQGFIQEKGTLNSVNALTRANLNNLKSTVDFYEEWAFRTGSYGVLDRNQVIEIQTNDTSYGNTKSIVKLLGSNDTAPVDIISVPFTGVYKKPRAYDATPFVYRTYDTNLNQDINKAGYPRIDDTNHRIFNIQDLESASANIATMGVGQEVWVAKDWNGSWNVYRIMETNTTPIKVTNATNGVMKIRTNVPSGVVKNEVVLLKDFNAELDGLFRVDKVLSELEFQVRTTVQRLSIVTDPQTNAPGSLEGSGNLYKLTSVRFTYPSQAAALDPLNYWKTGDKVFIDEYNTSGDWQVLEKTNPWTNSQKYTWASGTADDNYGRVVMLAHSNTWAAVGAPNESTGRVILYDVNSLTDLDYDQVLDITIGASSDIADDFGASLATGQLGFNYDGSTAYSDELLAVGAPATNSNRGAVLIYRYRNATWTLVQHIPGVSGSVGDEFGASVAISKDARWLYVGAPGENKVYAYGLDTAFEEKTNTLEGDGSTTAFQLDFTPKSSASILIVDNADKVYRETVDFSRVGKTITFTTAPADATLITVTENFYYKYKATLTGSDTLTGDRFGDSVWTSSDGTQTVVGAPQHDNAGDDSVVDSGTVYLFDRTVEAFQGDGSTTVFTTQRTLDADLNKVTVNGVLKDLRKGSDAFWDYTASGTTLTFNQAPPTSAIIKVDTNTFIQMQQFSERTANERGVGNAFGTSVVICPTDCSIYIGNPSDDPRELRNSGSVDRYVNQGRIYGSITSTKTSPTVTATHSIRINDFEVVFTGTTVDSVKTDINNANIAGVTAAVSSGVLTISSNSTIELQKLKVLPGTGTGLSDLGLDVFYYTQTILAPKGSVNSNFGDTLAISSDANTLFVGAPNCTMRVNIEFDVDATDGKPDTTFDVDSTTFFDTNPKSGAAYVFEYLDNPLNDVTNPGKFDFIQELEISSATDDMAENDRFGYSLATRGNYLLVGADQDDEQATNAGAVYDFDSSGVKGWKVLRSKTPQIEVDAINKAYLFDRDTKEILTYLDVYDPAKGKIIGAADQNLDYISSHDPASYENSSWADNYVGKYWWDTDQVRFIDYEQGSYLYKGNNWGTYFPGSVVKTYEWVKSDVLPSQYVASGYNGIPKDQLDGSYVTRTTGTKTFYYYWVGDRTETDSMTKSLTTNQVESLLTDPAGQGVSFIAIMENNLIGLFNCERYIKDDYTILGINYDTELNDGVLHNEFQLMQENKADTLIPTNIQNKLFDSLCAEDKYGNAVPQPNLPASERYGIDIRPRQTMFVDRSAALETLFKFVNSVMAKNQIVESRSLTKLLEKETAPTKAAGGWTESLNTYAELAFLDKDLFSDGYKVLVLADEQNNKGGWSLYELDVVDGSTRNWLQIDKQAYDTSTNWKYVNWYASDFDSTTIPDHVVETRNDLEELSLVEGNVARVTNRGNGLFEIVRVKADGTYEVVGLENGTIEFLSTLWTEALSGLWDDYNRFAYGSDTGLLTIGANVNSLWGTGQGDRGYGQATLLPVQEADTNPTTEDWTSMYSYITTIGGHQDTTLQTMSLTDVELSLDNIQANITAIDTNRLNTRANNVTVSKNLTSTGSWKVRAEQEIKFTWSDPDETRYFFNAGGFISVDPSVYGYTDDAKARSWDALTQMAGTLKITAQGATAVGDSTSATVTETHTSSVSSIINKGYYDLTSTDTLIFSKTLTTTGSPYLLGSPNKIEIYASTNGVVGDNQDNGTIITLKVKLLDQSTDEADDVDIMDGTVKNVASYAEPTASRLVRTWNAPTVTLFGKTHE